MTSECLLKRLGHAARARTCTVENAAPVWKEERRSILQALKIQLNTLPMHQVSMKW